ncbi:hypothetical protein PFISCL1PPCAC_3204, partial [Pristionchus fissidentatus]
DRCHSIHFQSDSDKQKAMNHLSETMISSLDSLRRSATTLEVIGIPSSNSWLEKEYETKVRDKLDELQIYYKFILNQQFKMRSDTKELFIEACTDGEISMITSILQFLDKAYREKWKLPTVESLRRYSRLLDAFHALDIRIEDTTYKTADAMYGGFKM